MRFGSPFYDLGSLLCDPYVRLSDGEIEELLEFYYGIGGWDLEWPRFARSSGTLRRSASCRPSGIRFLSLTRGLKAFSSHIPQGLANLLGAASHAGALPRLKELAGSCRAALKTSS